MSVCFYRDCFLWSCFNLNNFVLLRLRGASETQGEKKNQLWGIKKKMERKSLINRRRDKLVGGDDGLIICYVITECFSDVFSRFLLCEPFNKSFSESSYCRKLTLWNCLLTTQMFLSWTSVVLIASISKLLQLQNKLLHWSYQEQVTQCSYHSNLMIQYQAMKQHY